MYVAMMKHPVGAGFLEYKGVWVSRLPTSATSDMLQKV